MSHKLFYLCALWKAAWWDDAIGEQPGSAWPL
jgi:hypothetical protein